MASIMENISNLMAIFGRQVLSRQGRIEEVIEEHKKIFQALREKNQEKALKAMRHHLDTTEKHLLEQLKLKATV